jgi:hypothetical protein
MGNKTGHSGRRRRRSTERVAQTPRADGFDARVRLFEDGEFGTLEKL